METNNKSRKRPLIILSSIRSDFAYTIELVLKANGFDVCAMACSSFNLQAFESKNADLVLVDWDNAQSDSLNAVEKIRGIDKMVPIVFVTDRTEEDDLLKAYEAGIDSFFQHPVSIRLLVAHIKAIINKRGGIYPDEQHTVGEFTLDAESCVLHFRDSLIRLPYMETCLLDILIRNKNKVCETEQLLKLLWGKESEVRTANNINIYIYNLRQTLKRDPNVQIVNIRGVGFKLTELSSVLPATVSDEQS